MAESREEGGAPDEIRIFVDADACPVKPEVYRVAERYGLKVFVVANAFMNVPRSPMIERVIVPEGPDVADDWIAERAGANDIVVTADIPLAARCVRNGSIVIGPTGKAFDEDSIGMALATRNLMSDLRSAGATTRGPKPLSRQDVSRFLSALDLAVTRLKRK
ncbi:MAG TPA: YaiI/YqxD family protein [Pseudolabrys sp.]|nr:YaiI/YqxD family protein [Pseudolabrys sp.]